METKVNVDELRVVDGQIGVPSFDKEGRLTEIKRVGGATNPRGYFVQEQEGRLEDRHIPTNGGSHSIRELTDEEKLAWEQELLRVKSLLARADRIVAAHLIVEGHF